VASGRLSTLSAVLGAIAFVAIAEGLWFPGMNWRFGALAGAYFALSLAYSFVLKNVVILDVFVVAAGFVIRAAAGAEAVNVAVSPWLLICAMLLALFLALSKRRHEMVLLGDAAAAQRATFSHYTPYLLDQMMAVVTASTVVCYCLYTMWPDTVDKFGTHNLVYTIPFVLFGVYRYLYLVHRAEQGGSPEKVLLTDVPMLADVVLWLVAVGVILYGAQR
jgi:4-hydroxybenzoate polyprenyltransferase